MTKTRDLSDFLIEGGADLPLGKPHIVPGVLQPAVAGKLLNGADHSGAYGTAQTQTGGDGHKYYYTDIKGSKPIKDPRIGAYFGSQRHKWKSFQLLPQETATEGADVYSLDGREWARLYDKGGDLVQYNDSHYQGAYMAQTTTGDQFIEVVAYANDLNVLWFTGTTRNFNVSVNGGTVQLNTGGTASDTSPLGSRYVDATSVVKVSFNSAPSLGINTFKISNIASNWFYVLGIELIAQDTTSTANRSKIQIPAQNVVSFGKKFPISATADHYDPFSAKTDGSAWTSPTSGNNTANSAASWPTNIDTANSLGLENWVNGSSYYRPYNGGRVVKYVDSTGTIKTAVTVMPPNARSIGNAANLSGGAEKGDDSAGNTSAAAPNDNYRPTFTDQTIATAQDLHEVAKTFHYREFGNGSANGNASYKDASTLSADGNFAYVMDDGTTSFSANSIQRNIDTPSGSVKEDGFNHTNNDNLKVYITFIGTGFTVKLSANGTGNDEYDKYVDGVQVQDGGIDRTANVNYTETLAQNLPYGTHIITLQRGAETPNVFNEIYKEFSFHQPKKPPIPEDAVVLCDYMLMADFVGLGASNNTDKRENISKGVRRLSASRDVSYDNSTFTLDHDVGNPSGFSVNGANSDYTAQNKITFFGDKVVYMYGDPVTRFQDSACTFSSGTKGTTVDISSTNNNNIGARQFIITDGPRATTFTADSTGASNSYTTKNGLSALDLTTPIHTSSHYQSFETPFLHELIGGDRNMEQTNLVCSPDGKTWDEVTRDTSYIKKGIVFLGSRDGGNVSATNPWFADYVRGQFRLQNCVQKEDIAIAYDRLIFLKSGTYAVDWQPFYSGAGHAYVGINDTAGNGIRVKSPSSNINISKRYYVNVKRGDYLYITATSGGSGALSGDSSFFTQLSIEKV